MMKRRYVLAGVLMLLAVLMSASVGHAEMNADLRVKLGNAAGVTQVDLIDFVNGNATGDTGGNFQVELILSNRQQAGAYFVGGVGLFGRTHEGDVNDPFLPTHVQYDAGGVSGTAGIGVVAGPNFHMEGRVELDLGSGSPTLTTPGAIWNSTRDGGYAAWDLIVGGYYTVSQPGLQIGLELGVQSFSGDFQIMNGFGFWDDAKVKGSGGIANLVIGVRF